MIHFDFLFWITLLLAPLLGLIGIWWNQKQGWVKAIMSLLIMVGVIISYINYGHDKYFATPLKNNGEIRIPIEKGAKYHWSMGAIRSDLATSTRANEWGNDAYVAWIDQDGLLNFRMKLRDKDRKPIAYFSGKSWKFQDASLAEVNYDDDAVEIIDSEQNVVFQIVVNREKKEINIYGIFYPLNMGDVLLTPTVSQFDPTPEQVKNSGITQIFRYPSEQFPGKRILD